jgi:hypothetical protein
MKNFLVKIKGRAALLGAAVVTVVFGVSAVAVAVAVAGATASSTTTATEETAPAPGASGVVLSGPEISGTEADTIAREYAETQAGDPNPTSQLATKTIRSSATATIMHGSGLPASAPTALKEWNEASVYVETMHGRFTLSKVSVPEGEPAPSGTVLSLVIDAHTAQVSSIAVTSEAEAPSRQALEQIGNVRQVVGG